MDVSADEIGGLMKEGAAKLLIEVGCLGTFGGGEHVEQFLELLAACRDGATLAMFEPVDDEIAGDLPQPAAEGASFLGGIPAVDIAADGEEELLHDLAGVGVLKAVTPEEAIDEGLVERHKLKPGLVILRITKADEQARASGWREGHESS